MWRKIEQREVYLGSDNEVEFRAAINRDKERNIRCYV